MRVLSASLVGLWILAGCAGTAGSTDDAPLVRIDDVGAGRMWAVLWPELLDPAAEGRPLPAGAFPVRKPTRDQEARLRHAEQLWRARDAGFQAAAEKLLLDPITSFWLARLFVNDLLFATDHASAGTTILAGDPPWKRSFDALVTMGAEGAPCVVLDLLRFPRADRRDMGARILAAMGAEALGEWSRVLGVDDARGRRAAVDAVAGTGPGAEQLRLLHAALDDTDLGVRAGALRGFGQQGRPGSEILCERVRRESDPFLRKAAIEGLGSLSDKASAHALVQALEDALVRGDEEITHASRVALIQRSGIRRSGSVEFWRAWVSRLPAD